MTGKLIHTASNVIAYFITKINDETHFKCYDKVIVPVCILLGYDFKSSVAKNNKGRISLIIDNIASDDLDKIERLKFDCYRYFDTYVHFVIYDEKLFIEHLINMLMDWIIISYHDTIVAFGRENRINHYRLHKMLYQYKLARYIVKNTTLSNVRYKLSKLCAKIRSDETVKKLANMIGEEL